MGGGRLNGSTTHAWLPQELKDEMQNSSNGWIVMPAVAQYRFHPHKSTANPKVASHSGAVESLRCRLFCTDSVMDNRS
jgi:hypothetical protein